MLTAEQAGGVIVSYGMTVVCARIPFFWIVLILH